MVDVEEDLKPVHPISYHSIQNRQGYKYDPGNIVGSDSDMMNKLAVNMIMSCCAFRLTDADRRKPPKIGSIITYRFQEYTLDGVPRFPSYVGECRENIV